MRFDPDAAVLFLDFVEARHRAWQLRQQGAPQPWTDDPILASNKFTNIYRVLDPGSQFVFQLAQPEDGPLDVLARLFLYRYTNLPATWGHLLERRGSYPTAAEMGPFLTKQIQQYREAGNKVFSGAYVILPQPNRPGDKVVQAVELTAQFVREGAPTFLAATTQAERLNTLTALYGVGDFMGMQILTDWGYTAQCGEDRENDFVVVGPGSRRGAAHLAPGVPALDVIHGARDLLHAQSNCPQLEMPDGRTRPPSLMDTQNALCEFGKYVRFVGGKKYREQPYRPAHPGVQSTPVLPQHWT